jgi:hypothetical protein
MAVGILLLSKAKACEYLDSSLEELNKWIKPDRIVKYDNPRAGGMRLWSGSTLDACRPHIEQWREPDRLASGRAIQKAARDRAAAAARQTELRRLGAMLTENVSDALSCSLTELNRWAADGRLEPDGALNLQYHRGRLARCWLPAKIAIARDYVQAWREQDEIAKIARRRRREPPLRRIHSDMLYEQSLSARQSLQYHRTRTTEGNCRVAAARCSRVAESEARWAHL